MKTKFILLIAACILPNIIATQKTEVDLIVSEIRRVMPQDITTGESTHNHFTLVKVSNLNTIPPGTYNFHLQLDLDIITSKRYDAEVVLNGENDIDIIFEGPLQVSDKQVLVILPPPPSGIYIWQGYFNITDLNARVDVIAGDYVRVTPGVIGEVTDGKVTCKNDDNSPCYYKKEELKNFPPIIERCVTLDDDKGQTIKYCDDTVSQYILMEDEPSFLLLDNKDLNLKYGTKNGSFEVLVIDTDGKITNKDEVDCSNTNSASNGCSMPVNIPDGATLLNFTVVTIDEDGYITGSLSNPFEIFTVEGQRLTTEAVMAKWKPSVKLPFDVSIRTNKFDEPLYKMDALTCEGDATCESFFIMQVDHDIEKEYLVVVQIDNNAIATIITTDTPTQSIVTKIANAVAPVPATTFEFESTSLTPKSVKMIEVTTSGKDVSNNVYSGDVTKIPNGYKFKCTDEKINFEGIRTFLFTEEEEAGNVQGASAAYVTFEEYDVKLDLMAKNSVLRETVKDGDKIIKFEGKGCTQAESPCYIFSNVSPETDYVQLCITIENIAPDSKKMIDQCKDHQPNITEEVKLDKVRLLEGDPNSIAVTSSMLSPTCNPKSMLFSNYEPLTKNEESCTLEKDTCTINDVSLPDTPSTLSVLIMCTHEDSVTEAAVSDVDYLRFTQKMITEDSLLVHWTAINADEYLAELSTAVTERLSSRTAVSDYPSSSIECDSEQSCYATFLQLDSTKQYYLSVHKKDDEISETNADIGPLDTLPKPEAAKIDITKVSRVDDSHTKVSVSEDVTFLFKVLITVGIYDGEQVHQLSGKGIKDDVDNKIFSFNHSIPIFISRKIVAFEFIAYKDTQLLKAAMAELEVHAFDAKLAWVGNEQRTNGKVRSLRVFTGTQDEVLVGNKRCLKDNSPCYFIEASDFPEVLENCVKDSLNISQCNEEVTPYKELVGVEISLDGDHMVVSAPLDLSGTELEIKIYNPSDPSDIFSKGEISCDDLKTEETVPSIKCRQPLQVPNGVGSVKVIVSEVALDGTVLMSNLSIVPYPTGDDGVEGWIIAVSVIGSVFVVTVVVFVTVIALKKKKARKWQSQTVVKELDAISEIKRDATATREDYSHTPNQPPTRNNYPESQVSSNDKQQNPERQHYRHDEQPTLERQLYHHNEQPKMKKGLTRYDEQPHIEKQRHHYEEQPKQERQPYTKAPNDIPSWYDKHGLYSLSKFKRIKWLSTS